MWQFLLGSVPFMAPFYLLALVYSEGAVYLVSHRPRFLWLWAVGAIGLLLYLEYWSTGPSYVLETRPFAFFLVMLWIVSVPVAVVSATSFLIARVRRHVVQQILILATSAAVVFFWPEFALFSVCTSRLDCL